jgi:transposase
VLGASVWRRIIGVDRQTVIESVEVTKDEDAVVVSVRPRRATKRHCGRCGVRAPGYDQGEGRRRWRALDLGVVRCHIEATSPRVNCPTHGPTVAQVPWARHGAGHTYDFDDQVAWLVTHSPKSTVAELMRVAWRSVGSIIARVVADGRASHDPFSGLTRIGIDELSYKRGHRSLVVVVCHTTGRLVWAGIGREKKTLFVRQGGTTSSVHAATGMLRVPRGSNGFDRTARGGANPCLHYRPTDAAGESLFQGHPASTRVRVRVHEMFTPRPAGATSH